MGSKTVETINRPVPIPIDIFEKTFKNLDFVNPNIFKIIGMKNANDRKNILRRVDNLRLKNNKTIKIVNPIVG